MDCQWDWPLNAPVVAMRGSACVPFFPELRVKGSLAVARILQNVGLNSGVEVKTLTFRRAFCQTLMEQGLPLKEVKRHPE